MAQTAYQNSTQRPTGSRADGSRSGEREALAQEAAFLGPYKLSDRIGEGAMGKVYRAEHVLLGRTVAIKVLHPDLVAQQGPEALARFLDEARAANLARSEHVVDVMDLSLDLHGETFMVMELVDGESLATLCKRGDLTLPRSLEIVRQVCDALAVVHKAGVVHRDLKPDNILVGRSAGRDHVKILDFGIAKLNVVGHFEDSTTLPGWIVGTPQYMSPEQATAQTVDHRSDLYAVGTILFELLTGRAPFPSDSFGARLAEMATRPAPLLGQVVRLPPEVHDDLETLLARCLQRDPSERPQSAEEVEQALLDVAQKLRGDQRSWTHMRESEVGSIRAPWAVETQRCKRPALLSRLPTVRVRRVVAAKAPLRWMLLAALLASLAKVGFELATPLAIGPASPATAAVLQDDSIACRASQAAITAALTADHLARR